ncbi:unnamed protein product [Closterium sp. Yama58-4]|nr:unnamed protein product [Closterium sp. Yama58-4]
MRCLIGVWGKSKAAALAAVMMYCVAQARASTRKQSDWRARISMNGRRNFSDAFGLVCEANPRLKFDYTELICDEERTPTQVYNLASEDGTPLVKPLEKGGLLRWHFADGTMRPFGTVLFDIIVRNAFQKGAGGSATVVKAYHIAYLLYLSCTTRLVANAFQRMRIVNAADIASYHRKVKAAIRKTLEESPDDQLPAWSEQYQGWVFGPTETVVISGSGFPDLVPDGADPDAAEKKEVALLFEYAQVEPEKGKKKKTGSNSSDATMERDLLDDVGEWEDAEDRIFEMNIGSGVAEWVNQGKDYGRGKYPNFCNPGMQCGGYTQVVWRNTTSVGCAHVDCQEGWTVSVCYYYPADACTTAFCTQILGVHNTARSAVGVAPLVWNASLALRAQEWAKVAASSTQCTWVQYGDLTGVGQNQAYAASGYFTDKDIAQMAWVDEGQFYTRGRYPNTCSAGGCAHYTQVVWKKRRRWGAVAWIARRVGIRCGCAIITRRAQEMP